MDNHKFNFNVQSEDGVVTFRTGEAPKIHPPETLSITGLIDTPARFLEGMAFDTPKMDYVQVDYESGTIHYHQKAADHYGHIFSGVVQENPHLSMLCINSDATTSPKSLAKILKMKSRMFAHQEEYIKVFSSLMNFNAQIQTTIEDAKDQSKIKKLLEIQVEKDVPESFVLKCPVFKNDIDFEFRVHLWAEATSSSVSFRLESEELFYIKEDRIKELLAENLAPFEEYGCAIYYK